MDFGYLLKTARIEAGMGLRELARRIDISPSYLSMIENGLHPPPTAERIGQIEQVLKVPKGYLFSFVHNLDPDLLAFVQEVPEVADFLHAAREMGMKSNDFYNLASLLYTHGVKGLNLTISKILSSNGAKSGARVQNHGVLGPYLWPFLTEKLSFDVTGSTEKTAFLRHAVGRIASQVPGLDAETIFEDLSQRERTASTGIGHGIAVPHAYSTGLEGMIVALFRLPDGLDFDAIDDRPVHLVFILAGPRSDELLHLKLLARIARLFSHNTVYDKLLRASNHKEILSIVRSAEMCIP